MVTPSTTDDPTNPGPEGRVSAPDEPTVPDTSATPDSADVIEPRPDRHVRTRFRYTLPGAWVAMIFACLAFTPSLVPRPGPFQGVVCGINAAIGYGLGVTGAFVWREFADRPARTPRALSWRVFLIVGSVALVVSYVLGERWQSALRAQMDAAPEDLLPKVLLPIVAAAVFVALVAAGRGVRRLFRWVARTLARWMGRRAARALGWVLAALVTVGLVSGVLVDGIIGLTDRIFSVRDTTTSDTAVQPTTPLRSGGPGSLLAWDSLGYQGRNFVGQGPTAAEISAFSGTTAPEPIRAYAGIASAGDVEERARLAVADLERAGGFDRRYLLVAGTTGTGWVDPGAITAFEYEAGGDSAAVAIQYSYLPSWASFLVDQSRAREAGRALFDAVYQRWSALPANSRPKLLVFGLSLGSFAAESPFSGEGDLANRTDGALLAGSPSFNLLHREFTVGRDAGSPEIQPVYRAGRVVRFANDPSKPIAPEQQPWNGSRVLYLQHASDPIVWLSPDLILHRPDWLAEPPGPDVPKGMIWIPFVTFWQVTMDMLEPVDVEPGHGHSYTLEFVDGWAAVIQPPGWTTERADALRSIIAREPT
jgi:uncharacterized membrane protein